MIDKRQKGKDLLKERFSPWRNCCCRFAFAQKTFVAVASQITLV
ncbi:hypothetical protein LSPCS325_22150 [Lysinibacillus sp. CTST325]